ncbi:MAG: pullulanase-type alpha-1,6-glucosidase [Colwellia sp.]|nr:pullulanase-type alpha-1,6-glucosidase [Colwellia sp.]
MQTTKPFRCSLTLSTILLFATSLLFSCDNGVQHKTQADAAMLDKGQFSLEQLANLPSDSSAHWLSPQLILLPSSVKQFNYALVSIKQNEVKQIALTKTEFSQSIKDKFPHLTSFQAYKLEVSNEQSKRLLKQQLMVVAVDEQQQVQQLSYLQTAVVIDELYTANDQDANEVNDLGANIIEQGVSFKLWAPTAQRVELLLFNDDQVTSHRSGSDLVPVASKLMTEDAKTGVWSLQTTPSSKSSYYQYQITVYHPASKQIETLITTDPYSLSLSVNSHFSQVVDLNDTDTQPDNWQGHKVPQVKNVEDLVLYETHIRDFSSIDSRLSDASFRGKYKAFSEQNSYGIKHLKALKQAGLNTIHLLPTFDIATVNEDSSQAIDINDSMSKVCAIAPETTVCKLGSVINAGQSLKSLLKSYDPKTKQAQQLVSELRELDNFNWGYDPYHYTVPEGSYAINPQGKARLIEFRQMVQSLHGLGFRVIMDVVYNHTYQSGLAEKSVLDKIVPNYYHRLHPITGAVEQSTCCDNTATERVMMAKLMTDSLVVWARDYKIDGFRFDLMGHQPKQAVLDAREAVREVDGDTYFYGEGWNFGEVANNSQFVQASQLELGGSEIGTFSDRLRDAVRGGGNNTRSGQGMGNGLLTLPNEVVRQQQSQMGYDLKMAQLRIGLAANLANFPLTNTQGERVLGKDIPYGDQPTGYALDPADTINYVSKHDNQTLWDNSQYRLSFEVSTQNRVRMHLQSLSFTLFAQGIPFLHMGSEFLRSKSFLRDSYDYSDWFNRVDFSKQNNFYNVGLPPAAKDKDNWGLIKKVMAGHEGRDQVSAKHIEFSSQVFNDMLAIRMSSPLFRLTSERAIIDKVSFLNTENKSMSKKHQTGLIVMKLDDTKGTAVDENYQSIMVIFNTSDQAQTFNYSKAKAYQLHPIHQKGDDALVKQSSANEQGFTVSALSSVVFVKLK